MASKKTKRERKELARKHRLEAQRRAVRRRQLRKVYSLAVGAGVVVLIVALVLLSGRGARRAVTAVNQKASAAGCATLQGVLDPGANHVEGPVTYTTNPPTSGNHRGGLYDTGVYEQALENELQVHNLEHGHIVIQHKDLPKATVDALEAFAQEPANRQWVVVAPKPDMAHAYALTSWGRIVTCATAPDQAKAVELARQYVNAFRDKSPRESLAGTPRTAGAPAANTPSPTPTGGPSPPVPTGS